MKGDKSLVIGTRGSALALAQADMLQNALVARYPELSVRREIIHTTGDKRTDVPLADVAKLSGVVDKGVFIKELECALLDGRIDVAVHSLKDVPSELSEEFCLASVLPRASVQDVLITKDSNWDGCGVLATGSVRRQMMAKSYFGEKLQVVDLRGNVPTRLSKLVANRDWDAAILAKAGLERLGLYAPQTQVDGINVWMTPLPTDSFIPAVGQGIVGMECLASNIEVRNYLEGICDTNTFVCGKAERAFLVHLGATCSTPVGVFVQIEGAELVLRACYYEPSKSLPVNIEVRGLLNEPESLGYRAYKVLAEKLG